MTYKSRIWHEHNADGSKRKRHCCGCWIFAWFEPITIRATCNECGEQREAIATIPGIAL